MEHLRKRVWGCWVMFFGEATPPSIILRLRSNEATLQHQRGNKQFWIRRPHLVNVANLVHHRSDTCFSNIIKIMKGCHAAVTLTVRSPDCSQSINPMRSMCIKHNQGTKFSQHMEQVHPSRWIVYLLNKQIVSSNPKHRILDMFEKQREIVNSFVCP